MKTESLLARLKLSFTCPMDWETMAGDGQARFCDKCQKSVTNLSALEQAEAETFLAENSTACVRISRDSDGRILTKGCGSMGLVQADAVRATAKGALIAGGLALASCSSDHDVMHTMGVPAPPPSAE